METKANHVLIGAFTLLVSVLMVLFALWAAKFTSDAAWREYDVIFKEPVSGLSTGSPVQYNGIGIGTVRDLSLAPDDPRQVIARVRLRSSAPVLEDTEASLAFIGLTGVAFIQLSGGSPGSPALLGTENQVPSIVAQSSAFQKLLSSSEDIATAATQVLLRLSAILSEENAERVAGALDAINALAKTLAGEREQIRATLRSARLASEHLEGIMGSAERVMERLDHGSEVMNQTLVADLPQISTDLKQALASLAAASKQAEVVLGPQGAAADALGARGIGQAGPTLAELRALLRQISSLSAQIEQDPAAFLLGGDDRKEFKPK
ncbi:MAG: MlaD family protein [Xanthomonadaceae bacterium]|nr:MlaD family protein [Xanthomonadaceae bacterium]MDP2184164.1 MlaD family protein [Xanthomonadales bacterium]MDZ4114438.1 MlaD family protein [Xanthomonadaceae bacterium]MDZ4376739.1 MlaD family protein [Xanthomonadaceae bacterium]